MSTTVKSVSTDLALGQKIADQAALILELNQQLESLKNANVHQAEEIKRLMDDNEQLRKTLEANAVSAAGGDASEDETRI